MQIYKVGGAVRDKILGIKSHDNDYVVVGSTPKQMQELGFKSVGKSFPVFLHPKTKEEYALARIEKKTGDKHTDFEFVFSADITLKQDLQRRDLTCNAIAYDEKTGKYIDYFGGIEDIQNKILRHIDGAHFIEDPLRVLRVCRFAAQLDFDVCDETLALCKKMVEQGALKHLSTERILEELKKALQTPKSSKFFILAHQIGALKEIMPELDVLYDIPENTLYHPEGTTFLHIMHALDTAPNASLIAKFSILTHDLGKALTPPEILPSHKGHENRAADAIVMMCRRLKIQKRYQKFALAAAKLHMLYFNIFRLRAKTIYELINKLTIMHISHLEAYIDVCRADFESSAHEDIIRERIIFEKKAEYLRFAQDTLKNIKTTDMPGFSNMPKDARFAEKLMLYQLDILQKKLKKFKKQTLKNINRG